MSKKDKLFIIVFIFVISLIVFGNIYIKSLSKKIKNENIEYYDFFKNNELLDVNGKINLSNIKKISKEKEELVFKLIGDENIDEISFLLEKNKKTMK